MLSDMQTIDRLVLARNALLAVHLLSVVVWVGGLVYALRVLNPALATLEPAAKAMQMQLLTMKKFFFLIWHVMPMLLLSGWGMIFLAWGGFRLVPLHINIMQGLGVLMALVFVAAYVGPYKRVQRAIRATPEMFVRLRRLMVANLLLGTAAIIAGSLGHVW